MTKSEVVKLHKHKEAVFPMPHFGFSFLKFFEASLTYGLRHIIEIIGLLIYREIELPVSLSKFPKIALMLLKNSEKFIFV